MTKAVVMAVFSKKYVYAMRGKVALHGAGSKWECCECTQLSGCKKNRQLCPMKRVSWAVSGEKAVECACVIPIAWGSKAIDCEKEALWLLRLPWTG